MYVCLRLCGGQLGLTTAKAARTSNQMTDQEPEPEREIEMAATSGVGGLLTFSRCSSLSTRPEVSLLFSLT